MPDVAKSISMKRRACLRNKRRRLCRRLWCRPQTRATMTSSRLPVGTKAVAMRMLELARDEGLHRLLAAQSMARLQPDLDQGLAPVLDPPLLPPSLDLLRGLVQVPQAPRPPSGQSLVLGPNREVSPVPSPAPSLGPNPDPRLAHAQPLNLAVRARIRLHQQNPMPLTKLE